MSNSPDPTKRFSSRVADYVKYRPDYPSEVLAWLRQSIGLNPDWIVADIGCGTGISSRLFLDQGNTVFGVEPNPDMLAAAKAFFADRPRFVPRPGSAEATGLDDHSVDLVIAAQAFHWFARAACAIEWRRILRFSLGGWILLMWNTRLTESSPFAIEYDKLLHQYGTDYEAVAHQTMINQEAISQIFDTPFRRTTLPNFQIFTLEALRGRVRSSSYTPLPGQNGHDELFASLDVLFDQHQKDGVVRFEYETELFLGKCSSPATAAK